ncbi:tripartite tricarboxylate transporter substrate binding protein [Metabacillus litoralis]|jgi:tripartite-type tricarboxylate transporter receptor subunit TctC|uniref:tripartite tricarboxylate transporter substrate binding protein n=1 Tax=Metabacillus litoralis TaxID=152268 RepID=UPI00203EF89C|nr:tripartite tricarboxylate transporter substrate binding protein [Metabacillus litoralis]MCM3651372.1 tripartite tricarboxylate transporter substrate binding protein [Metabacillus litoralis]
MKRLLSFVTMLVFIGILTACAGNEGASTNPSDNDSSKSDFPTQPISVIVSYDAGGGTDITARTLTPYLEKELGVPVNVINQPGGSGWVGWTTLANAKPDGYTIGYLNSPNIAGGLVNPSVKRDVNLDSFEVLGNHVADPGVIAIRTDEDRFTNLEELIEYAKKNKLKTNGSGVASDEHLVSLMMNKKLGTNIEAVQFEGTANSSTAFLGGHIDILVTSAGEAYNLHNSEQLKVIGVAAKEKSAFLPDVPTFEEAGYEGVYSQATRGLAAPKGVDPEKIKILQAALEKAINNAEHIKKMEKTGTQVSYATSEEYRKMLEQDIKDITDLKDLLGW